jgi:putative transcriptional regulator
MARPNAVRVPYVDVAEVRAGLGLTIPEFAQRFGLTPASVRNWEAGHTQPYGVARILLAIIAAHPDVVDAVLQAPRAIEDRPDRKRRSR